MFCCFRCECRSGFSGKNCELDVDDCVDSLCQNEAKCVDAINSYSCQCVGGFEGRYCEVAPQRPIEYPQSSACQRHDCQNGGLCYQPRDSNEYICTCPPGYDGKKCEKLRSVSFVDGDAFAQLPSLDVTRRVNVTIVMATHRDEGVVLYQGYDQHVAVEIFRGRIRCAKTVFLQLTQNRDFVPAIYVKYFACLSQNQF